MVQIIGRKQFRRDSGYTLTELLVTCLLLGLTSAVIGEMVVLNTFAVWKTTNKSDALNSARWAIERISSDVRKARFLGDHYATNLSDVNQFPADSGNPLYYASPPIGGWPWSGAPYILSQTCLIVQMPVLFENSANPLDPRNGFPSMIPAQAISPGIPVTNVENLETVIYQLVPDPQITGEYMLQSIRLPGATILNASSLPYTIEPNQATSVTINNPPQTLVRGIVGPIVGGNQVPWVFSYYAKNPGLPPTLIPQASPVPWLQVPILSGIAIDFELKKPVTDSPTATTLPYQETVAIHAEAAMRYNTKLQLTNFAQR